MSWLGQALHVARKDVLMARWLVLALIALIVAATAPPAGYVDGALDDWALQFVLVGAAMFLVAVVVQADSPVRSDAFWVTRPLRPSAVLAAKLLVALAFLAVALVGQSIALRSFDIPARDYVPHLADSALATGVWLAGAAAVAALTRDLRMFVVAFVALLVGGMLLVSVGVLWEAGESEIALVTLHEGPPATVVIVLLMLALAGLVAHQYVTRRRVRTLVIAAVLAAAVAFPSRLPVKSQPVTFPAEAPAGLRAQVADAYVSFPDARVSQLYVDLVLELDGALSGHRYTVTEGRLEIRLPDGTVQDARVDPLHAAMSPAVTWSGATSRLVLRVDVTRELLATLRAGSAALSFIGHVAVAGKTDMGALPLSGRGTVRQDGRRVRVVHITDPAGDVTVQVVSAAVVPPRGAGLPGHRITWGRDFSYTLVAADGEVVRAFGGSSSGSSASLVLPGPHLYGEVSEIRIDRTAAMSAERLRGAALHVGLWRSLGEYRVRSPVALRREATR